MSIFASRGSLCRIITHYGSNRPLGLTKFMVLFLNTVGDQFGSWSARHASFAKKLNFWWIVVRNEKITIILTTYMTQPDNLWRLLTTDNSKLTTDSSQLTLTTAGDDLWMTWWLGGDDLLTTSKLWLTAHNWWLAVHCGLAVTTDFWWLTIQNWWLMLTSHGKDSWWRLTHDLMAGWWWLADELKITTHN